MESNDEDAVAVGAAARLGLPLGLALEPHRAIANAL